MIFTDEQERRGAVLAASGIHPTFLRLLANEIADIDSALDIARWHPKAKGPYLSDDGEIDESAIKADVKDIAERFGAFGGTIITEEEREALVKDAWGEEGVDWEWQDTPFGRKRRKITRQSEPEHGAG